MMLLSFESMHAGWPQPTYCDFCGGEHVTGDCHLYFMKNSLLEQEVHPHNQL